LSRDRKGGRKKKKVRTGKSWSSLYLRKEEQKENEIYKLQRDEPPKGENEGGGLLIGNMGGKNYF